MDKYVGRFRVVCEFDRATLKPINDDNYIVCANSGQVFRVGVDTLAYYRPTRGNAQQMCDKLISLGAKDIVNKSTDGDILIHFKEESLEIIADVFRASTNGAGVNPTSVRNLRKQQWFKDNKQLYIDKGLYRELTEEEKEVLRNRFKSNL